MSESHVENEIQARIARVRAEEDRRRQQRAELAAAREKGLAHRHATKLRHLATPYDGAANQHRPEEPPTVPAALRTACCPACRCERLARLMTTVTVGGSAYDVLRCSAQACELLWLVRIERPRTAPVAA